MLEEARERSSGDSKISISLEMLTWLANSRQWDRFEAIASEIRLSSQKEKMHRSSFHRIMANRELLRNNPYAALAELEKAETATPFNALIALEKARIYVQLGYPSRASSEYRKALKIDPDNEAASTALHQLESQTSRSSL